MNIKIFFSLVVVIIASQAKASECLKMMEDYYNYVKEGNCLMYYMTTNNANMGRIGYSDGMLYDGVTRYFGVKTLYTRNSHMLWNDRQCFHYGKYRDQPFCTLEEHVEKRSSLVDLAFYLTNDNVWAGLSFQEWNSNYIVQPLQCDDGIISGTLKSDVGRALMTLSFKKVKCIVPPK